MDAQKRETYSASFAFAYIFNLIVGLGALSLPYAFGGAGYILGIVLMVVLCLVSYVTATYVIEAMATANAYVRLEARRNLVSSVSSAKSLRSNLVSSTESERTALINEGNGDIDHNCFEITEKFELGAMANMFYHPVGTILCHICICLYLFGDLAIYLVAIPTSIKEVVCPEVVNLSNGSSTDVNSSNFSRINNSSSTIHCFGSVTHQEAYYIFLTIAIFFLAPWSFFSLPKTKILQVIATAMRGVALTLMVIIGFYYMFHGPDEHAHPRMAQFSNFPAMFGVSIYAFMCHHSLPGMITPMKSKRGLFLLLGGDFMLILALYLLLSCVGAFWLENPYPLFTLNFFTPWGLASSKALSFFGYYIALFPVFTLSTNVPIVSITLRENIKSLFRYVLKRWIGGREFPFVVSRLVFPVLVILPPIAVAYATQHLETLVSVTGAFPGTYRGAVLHSTHSCICCKKGFEGKKL